MIRDIAALAMNHCTKERVRASMTAYLGMVDKLCDLSVMLETLEEMCSIKKCRCIGIYELRFATRKVAEIMASDSAKMDSFNSCVNQYLEGLRTIVRSCTSAIALSYFEERIKDVVWRTRLLSSGMFVAKSMYYL